MAEQDGFSGILGSLLGGSGDGAGDGIDPEILLKLIDIMSKLGEENRNTEFLRALRPLLREENRSRLDRASVIVKLAAVLPALRESGLL